MVFSPYFVEKISRPNLGAKRKKTQKKPHKRSFFKATNKQIESVPIRTSFTLGEPVSLVKVFRLFRLEQIFFGV
jgi:hypothetical protein